MTLRYVLLILLLCAAPATLGQPANESFFLAQAELRATLTTAYGPVAVREHLTTAPARDAAQRSDEPDGAMPEEATLSEAYPNPFREQTSFTLHVATPQQVRVEVFDLLGRQVAVLYEGAVAADIPLSLTWEAADAPAGFYVYRATGETFRATRRVTKAN